jgi:hypothetical protein
MKSEKLWVNYMESILKRNLFDYIFKLIYRGRYIIICAWLLALIMGAIFGFRFMNQYDLYFE